MAGNGTEASPKVGERDNSIAIAIILPSIFAIVLFMLIITALILPRMAGRENPAIKEARRKKRLATLDGNIKTQHFVEWVARQKEQHPSSNFTTDPMCAICLDEFDDTDQIRGLRCCHAFHAQCLDEWFGRWNEFCPLCHRPIIPGMKPVVKKERIRPEPLPVAFLV